MKEKINNLIQDWKIELAQIVFEKNKTQSQKHWTYLHNKQITYSKFITELYELIK